jgi:hypothetical protein
VELTLQPLQRVSRVHFGAMRRDTACALALESVVEIRIRLACCGLRGTLPLAMRRLHRVVVCSMMCISWVLMPYSTLHAHVDDHDHTHVHGGHVHDFGKEYDLKHADQVVPISVTAATSPTGLDWTHWLPIFYVLTGLALALPFLTAILRPPERDSEPIPRRFHWQPPLRGPPAISIRAL